MRFGLYFGVLALLVVFTRGLTVLPEKIQAELTERTDTLLQDENLTWVSASMDGRDLTVRGTPPDTAEKIRANKALHSISGIRVIHSHLSEAPSETPENESIATTGTATTGVTNSVSIAQSVATKATDEPSPLFSEPPIIDKSLLVDASLIRSNQCQHRINTAFKGEKVNFQINTSKTLTTSKNLMSRLVKALDGCKGVPITIAGYTDSLGAANVNLKLSEARAIAIKNYMVKQGIPEASLNTVGYGESKPIASNKTNAGRAKNRRIEITTGG